MCIVPLFSVQYLGRGPFALTLSATQSFSLFCCYIVVEATCWGMPKCVRKSGSWGSYESSLQAPGPPASLNFSSAAWAQNQVTIHELIVSAPETINPFPAGYGHQLCQQSYSHTHSPAIHSVGVCCLCFVLWLLNLFYRCGSQLAAKWGNASLYEPSSGFSSYGTLSQFSPSRGLSLEVDRCNREQNLASLMVSEPCLYDQHLLSPPFYKWFIRNTQWLNGIPGPMSHWSGSSARITA